MIACLQCGEPLVEHEPFGPCYWRTMIAGVGGLDEDAVDEIIGATVALEVAHGRRAQAAAGRPKISHGTSGGYRAHYRLGVLPACEPCRKANSVYQGERRRSREMMERQAG